MHPLSINKGSTNKMNTIQIKISLENITEYTEIIDEDDSINFVEHDGVYLTEELLSLLKDHIYELEEEEDKTKIYQLEFVSHSYLTDNIQATDNIDITAYTKIPPYPSWIIGDDGEWTPPVPYPDEDGSGMGTLYNWNEETTSWKDILV